MTTPRRVAIVTGASSGIGRATALRLARGGWTVALVARRAKDLDAVRQQVKAAGGAALVLVADLGKLRDIDYVVTETLAIGGRIDALVNVAGIGGLNSVATAADDEVQRMISTNLLAPIRLMRAVIPIMRAQGGGTIVNIGSVKGEIGIGGIYSATKFGLRGLTDSVRREVAGTGIRVCLVEPGYIATAMTAHRGRRMPGPDIVARAIEDCLAKPRRRIVVPGRYRILIWASILLPGLVDSRYDGKITEST